MSAIRNICKKKLFACMKILRSFLHDDVTQCVSCLDSIPELKGMTDGDTQTGTVTGLTRENITRKLDSTVASIGLKSLVFDL